MLQAISCRFDWTPRLIAFQTFSITILCTKTTRDPQRVLLEMNALIDDLIDFNNNLSHFIEQVERKFPNNPEAFRCAAGPWLSRQLLPRPEQENSCRFLSCFVNGDKSRFVDEVLKPLVGVNPFKKSAVCAEPQSILGKLQAFSPEDFKLLRGLELRLATILCVYECDNNFGNRLKALISAYQNFSGDSQVCWSKTEASKNNNHRTVAWHALRSLNSKIADEIDNIAKDIKASYLDPAVAFLIDTILECSGSTPLQRAFKSEDKDVCSAWDAGHTWIMTVATKQDRGVIFKLLVEAVSYEPNVHQAEVETVGAFYPHPRLGVSFQIGSDFQEAIRNAWLATVGQKVSKRIALTTDFRWSLIPYDSTDRQPMSYESFKGEVEDRIDHFSNYRDDWEDVKDESLRHLCLWNALRGPSATLAFGIAMRSVLEGHVLRKDIAATAEFTLPNNIDCNSITSNPLLSPVGAVRAKLKEGGKFGIKHLLVATGQTEELFMAQEDWRRHNEFEEAYKDAYEIEYQLRAYADFVAGRWDRIVEAGRPTPDQPDT